MKLAGFVSTSRLVGGDLRPWHRLWTDYGQTGNRLPPLDPLALADEEAARPALPVPDYRKLTGATLISECRRSGSRGSGVVETIIGG